ncbi:hypothetical protein AYO49_01490 [Verrucomicrobiaceae bacterium SCGC AG-212-N21]|nr:hypothetical protein AYO49_01490 [Verrucomicrobiaceae bacterium SCGC AG-212-N21]
MLKPQDILVALKLVALGTEKWTYASLAKSLGLSVSETHAAVKRGLESRLLAKLDHLGRKAERPLPNLAHLERLIVHGLPYWMPVPRGPRKICMGMPTADGVSPLDDEFFRPTDYLPPVWPVRSGKVKGWALAPIHPKCVPASQRDAGLYELLTLVDGLRAGKARVRQAAERILLERFSKFSRQLRS